jgi:hypothetical protein
MTVCQANLPGCLTRSSHTHHRLLRSQGGAKGPTIELCSACHDTVHQNPARAYATGLLLHAWDDLDTPVRLNLWVASF